MYSQVARKQTYLWRRIYRHGAETNLPGMVINLARKPGSEEADLPLEEITQSGSEEANLSGEKNVQQDSEEATYLLW